MSGPRNYCKCHDPGVPVWYDEDAEEWRDAVGNIHTPMTWDDYA